MKDNEMKDKEYEIKRIKEMFRIGLRTDSYSPSVWEYISRKVEEYKIEKDIVDILEAYLKAGLFRFI